VSPRSNGLQTEFEFTLPRGYVDSDGTLHRKGVMRLATAIDEIAPLRDPRVKQSQAYLTIILLSRVITKLGTLPDVNPGTIEGLFSSDLTYVQNLYRQINENPDGMTVAATCPDCGRQFEVETVPAGGS